VHHTLTGSHAIRRIYLKSIIVGVGPLVCELAQYAEILQTNTFYGEN